MRKLLVLVVPFLAMACSAEPVQSAAMTDARVKELVAEYIKENPKLIFETISTYLENEQKNAANAAMEDAFKNPVAFEIKDHVPVMGAADAPITIIQFAEFECPFCARAHTTLQEVERRYKSKMRMAFVNLPLPFHKQAMPAAMAGVAAQRQGKFWEFYDILFENQDKLGEKLYTETAEKLGLNMEQFNKDRQDPKVEELVKKDIEDANAIGARGTPYFLINGVPLNGAQPVEAFEALIEQLLARTE